MGMSHPLPTSALWGLITYLGVPGVRYHPSLPFVLGTDGNLHGVAEISSHHSISNGGTTHS